MGEGTAMPETADADDESRPRAVAYLRVSRPQQIDGYGIPYQRARTSEFIEQRGWARAGEFTDLAFTGRMPAERRPGFAELLEQAKGMPRPFDKVVVSEGRAVGRSGREFWRAVWVLDDLGVAVVIASDDPEDSLLRQAEFAEAEWKAVRQRTQGGLQAKALQGGHVGGVARYGYRIEAVPSAGTGSRLVVDECDGGLRCVVRDGVCETVHEAAVLRRARDLVVEHEGNMRRACLALNAEGFFSRSGRPWTYENLRKRLLSYDLLSARYVFRDPNRKGERGTQLGADGQPLNGETVVVHLDPVFSPGEVTELQSVIAKRSPRERKAPDEYPLSGLMHAPCGARYVGASWKGGHKEYRCSGNFERQYSGAPKCGCRAIRAIPVEEWAWRQLRSSLVDAHQPGDAVEVAAAVRAQQRDRLAALERRITEQRRAVVTTSGEIDRLRALPVGGGTAADVLERARDLLADDLLRLQALWREAHRWQKEKGHEDDVPARCVDELVMKARRAPDGTTWAERSELFTLLGVRVEVYEVPTRPRGGDRCSVGTWFRQHDLAVPVLTDEAWLALAPKVTVRGVVSARTILEALLHKAATGMSWPALDERFGGSFHQYWKRWNRNGLWRELADGLAGCATVPVHQTEMLPAMRMAGSIGTKIFSATCPAASASPWASGPLAGGGST